MRVLVTGGSGFLGSSVIPLLVRNGHFVSALARSERAAIRVIELGASAILGDLDDPASLERAFAESRAEALVNLASLGFGHAPLIVRAAQRGGLNRAVFVSTTAIFTSLDARSKATRLAAEEAIRASSLEWTIIRPTMIYGGLGDRNMVRLLRLLRWTPLVFLPRGGTTLQQPVHVDDVAAAVVTALEAPHAVGRAYDVGGPEPLSLRQLVEDAGRAVGRRYRFVPVPLEPLVAAARLYERLAASPRIRAEQLERLAEDKAFDIGAAQRDLGFAPRPFFDGISAESSLVPPEAVPAARVALFLRTLSNHRPAQILHRGRLRALRFALGVLPRRSAGVLARPSAQSARGWPTAFEPLDERVPPSDCRVESCANGIFCFLNETRSLGNPPDWVQAGATRLWRYHLHYFEWAWPFLAHRDRPYAQRTFRALWRSWRCAVPFSRGDAWDPYPASLRTWALCGVFGSLVAGTEDEADFLADIALHAGYLRSSTERDVSGNHLVKNLKALIGAGVFLDDEELVDDACRELSKQLEIQVLPDGGHFERSPSYHCQVLGDLIDIRELLAAAHRTQVEGIDRIITSMRRWLGAMLHPDGDVPLFNDATLVGIERIAALEPERPTTRLSLLEPSGFLVVRQPGVHVVLDVGLPSPRELPAHAHADCLSFELSVGGRRIIVDSGTSTYAPGPRRRYERSTPAHNTVDVDGQDQSEVWGTFRAARLANPRLEHLRADPDDVTITASHDGYRRLPGQPVHRRSWSIGETSIQIRDEVVGEGTHRVAAHFHLSPECEVIEQDGTIRAGPLTLCANGGRVRTHPVTVANGFGVQRPSTAIAVVDDGQLPLRIQTTITWGSDRAAQIKPDGRAGRRGTS